MSDPRLNKAQMQQEKGHDGYIDNQNVPTTIQGYSMPKMEQEPMQMQRTADINYQGMQMKQEPGAIENDNDSQFSDFSNPENMVHPMQSHSEPQMMHQVQNQFREQSDQQFQLGSGMSHSAIDQMQDPNMLSGRKRMREEKLAEDYNAEMKNEKLING